MVKLFVLILFALANAENQQVNRLLDDYFEWKIDTFKVRLNSIFFFHNKNLTIVHCHSLRYTDKGTINMPEI